MADEDASAYPGLRPADRDAVIRTVVTEAGHDDPLGQAAVASVVRNRLQAGGYGANPTAIVRAPSQFEVWQNGRAQAVDPTSPEYEKAGRIVDAVAAGLPDPTGGMTHFYSPSGQAALGRAAPSWGRGGGVPIGGNTFYAPQGSVPQQAPASAAIERASPPAAFAVPANAQPAPPQGQAMADDPLAVLKRYGVKTDDAAVAPVAERQQPSARPAPGVTYAPPAAVPAEDGDLATLARYGVKTNASPIATAAPTATAPITHAEPSTTPIGINDTVRAAATGVPILGGLANKADAGLNALLAPVLNGMFAPKDQLQGSTFGERYANSLAQQEGLDRSFADQHPVASMAANIAGGIAGIAPAIAAAPAAFGISGAPLAARAALGGVTSGALGGGDSAVRGENSLVGGALGLAGGAAGPLAGRALGATASAIGRTLNPGVDGLNRPAVNLLTQALTADSPDAVRATAARLGPQAALPDLGPSMGGLAQGLAVKPGDAKSAIFNMLEQRAGGANERISTDLNTLLGAARDPQAVSDGILARRAAQGGDYQAVHAQNAPVDVGNVVRLIDGHLGTADAPIATGAQRTALQNLRGQIVARPAQAATDTAAATPEAYHTNSQYMHNLRQDIDTALDGSAPSLGVPAGAVQRAQGTLGAVRGALDQALKAQVPGMEAADAASAALARQAEAVQAGTQALGAGKTTATPEAFARDYASMAPEEQHALNAGLRGEIDRLVGTTANDPAALRRALQGEGGWNTAKLATVFGDDNANRLVQAVGREGTFGETMNRVVGNSQTAQRSAAASLLKDTDPAQINFLPASGTGLALQGAKKFAYDPIVNALMTPNNGPRDAQLGRALSMQGPARDALINQLDAAARGAGRTTAASRNLDRAATVGTNLMLQPFLRRKYQEAADAR